jgi:peptidyl-prolyl cis-trans isomerase C
MRHLLSTTILAVSLALAAPAFADDYVMMKVNNKDVTKSEVETMWQGLFPPGSAPSLDQVKPEMRDKILRGVMTEKLLLGEAEKSGVDKSPEVQKQLDEVKKKIVVKTFLDQKTGDMITDADLKREYDAMVASMRDEKEIRARHILVPTEKEAQDVKAQLAGGKSFEDVAQQYSKDPGSAKQGGDLGYFTKDKMVKEFAEAAFKLKKGDVSDPVKTPFGWHVIKIEDVRKVTVPTYNDAKEMLRAKLQDKKLSEYINGLVKGADVKLYDAKGAELKFSKEIPAASDAKK